MHKVLVLGAGMVARPLVRYLMDSPGYQVTVASRTVSKAEALVGEHPQGKALAVNVQDDAALGALIRQNDLTVSLVPYVYHLNVAHRCLEHKKHLVTTSYVKPPIQALDSPAKEAGVILLNEIGLDPGIDHMSAMQIIDGVQKEGGQVTTFISYCGGLPAPEANTNPFGYKFSWSPRGVIMAGKSPAHYQWEGKEVHIPGEELFDHHWPVQINGLGTFEGYPNRDSMPYTEVYGIRPSGTMFRGTLRYPGWCATLKKLSELSLMDDSVRDDLSGLTFAQLTGRLVQAKEPAGANKLRAALVAKLEIEPDSFVISNLEWLGLLSDNPLPSGANTLMDVLVARMLELMPYEPGERDMIVLHHIFVAEYPDRAERITSTLIDYGIPHGDTSMARTVSLPAAIAVKLVLSGQIAVTGVQVPVLPEIYNPVLAELETLGIKCVEETHRL